MASADVVIVGGGIVGSAVAYFLSSDAAFRGRRIVLIERDPSYREASTSRSAGGVRQQFSTPENIAPVAVHARPVPQPQERVRAGRGRRLPRAGLPDPRLRGGAELCWPRTWRCSSRWAPTSSSESATELARLYPWLSPRGLRPAAYSRSGEGWYDPPSLAALFRQAAKAQGVEIRNDEVIAIEKSASRDRGRALEGGDRIACGALVNAAGPWAGQLAAMAGVPLPVEPRKRYVYVIDCREAPEALHRGAAHRRSVGRVVPPRGEALHLRQVAGGERGTAGRRPRLRSTMPSSTAKYGRSSPRVCRRSRASRW